MPVHLVPEFLAVLADRGVASTPRAPVEFKPAGEQALGLRTA